MLPPPLTQSPLEEYHRILQAEIQATETLDQYTALYTAMLPHFSAPITPSPFIKPDRLLHLFYVELKRLELSQAPPTTTNAAAATATVAGTPTSTELTDASAIPPKEGVPVKHPRLGDPPTHPWPRTQRKIWGVDLEIPHSPDIYRELRPRLWDPAYTKILAWSVRSTGGSVVTLYLSYQQPPPTTAGQGKVGPIGQTGAQPSP
ncbi:hypothetical protein H4R33_001862 [Dimargaris cristalligena]|uniref:Uncharacterized protein n=1 Tax=Dimargaris cristalligena TaxID=215637 RepID=A0A4Q0A2X6_9FUNG|nr:hypothetical protein H4R33_001862 [Dimargaris cristalligena]RKP40454.1 hypothetical protein BJ085DRAFT_37496 [Dimargaris cristalligena]|eukprot:RKP40454.1 hypothetical protein BJ085DRAFT_37496 [Dimargaris cristalligena]